MEEANTPAKMQALVMEKLIKAREETPKREPKAPKKFAKLLSENIEPRLRDRLFDETEIEVFDPSQTSFHDFAETSSNPTPIVVFWGDDNSPAAILRCDAVTTDVLSRLCFGGDVETSVKQTEKEVTAAELGLIRVFSSFLVRAMNNMPALSIARTGVFASSEFENDDLPNANAVICKYTIRFGANDCTIELAVDESLVMGVNEQAESETDLDIGTVNHQFLQAEIDTNVRLMPVQMTLDQFRTLKVGDQLPIGSNGQLEGRFLVDEREIFNCVIGRSGEKYSLKILDQANGVKTEIYSQLLAS